MKRRPRFRTLVAAALIALLLPLSSVQAAPVMFVPASDPTLALPEAEYAPEESPSLAEAGLAPGVTVEPDRGLEALGGPTGLAEKVNARRAALLQEQARAVKAEQPAAKARPVQLETPAGPRPKAPAQATASAPAAAAVTTAAAPGSKTEAKIVDMQPRPAAMPSAGTAAVRTAAQSYTLALSRDMFNPGEAGPIDFSLNDAAGAPVAGALIRIGAPTAPSVTTDSQGYAQATYSAPQTDTIAPVYVTLPGTAETVVLAEVYTLRGDRGVLIVEGVTDRYGAPVSDFDLTAASTYGWWGRWTNSGRIALIVPASADYHVEVTTRQGESLFLYQSSYISGWSKTRLHPSGSNTIPVYVSATVDDVREYGSVYLHSTAMPIPSWGYSVGETVYATPGQYDLIWVSQSPEPIVLQYPGVWVSEPVSVPLSVYRSNLGRMVFDSRDGYNLPRTFTKSVALQLPSNHVRVQPTSLLVEVGTSVVVAHYGDQYNTPPVWDYNFSWANEKRLPVSVSAGGQEVAIPLGGPLTHPEPRFHCAQPQPGCGFEMQAFLTTAQGDRIVAYSSPDGGSSWTPAQGTLSLLDSAGNAVRTQSFSADTWYRYMEIPWDAAGSYKIVLEWPDLGPYAPPYRGEWSFTVQPPPTYSVTLSREFFKPFEQATVTVTVYRDGVPAGANVQVYAGDSRYGTVYTDANSQATFTFTPYEYREVIPFHAQTPEQGYVRIGEAYVVPDNYGVVRLTKVTDRTGQAFRDYQAQVFWADGTGQYDSSGGWSDWKSGTLSLVRPAGTNHIEVQTWGQDTQYFLYQSVEVTAGVKQELQVSGAGTVLVNATAEIDGQSRGGEAFLHNRAVPLPAWTSGAGMMNGVYVTPGTYTVQYRTWGTPEILLTRENVPLQADTTIAFQESTAGLTPLVFDTRDGFGNPMQQTQNIWLQTPGFIRNVNPNVSPLVTPGFAYAPKSYDINTPDGFMFQFYNQGTADKAAVPGQNLVLELGGPLAVEFTPARSGPYAPGEMVRFTTGLFKAGTRQRVTPRQSGWDVNGSVRVTDAYGGQWWSTGVSPWNYSIDVPLPQTAGTYTAELKWDYLGAYSNPVFTAHPMKVETVPLELTVTPKVIPLNTSTTVTVEAKRNGQPVANQQISAWWLGTKYTDANGKVQFTANESFKTAISIEAWGPYGTEAKTNLFALGSGDAGVEITGKGVNGEVLHNSYAAAEVQTPSLISRYSTYSSYGPYGAVVPAGNAFVELIHENTQLSYVLNKTVPVSGGQVTSVLLDGALAPEVKFTGSVDGTAVYGGRITLHPTASVFTSPNMGPWLNSGMATARVTPGSYEILADMDNASEQILATFPTRQLDGGSQSLAVKRADLGGLHFAATMAGAPTYAETTLRAGNFWVYPRNDWAVLATPGMYTVNRVATNLVQANNDSWRYEYVPDTGMEIKVLAGLNTALHWPLDIVSTKVKAPATYQASSTLNPMLSMTTQDGLRLERVRNMNTYSYVAPTNTTITDPANAVVYEERNSYSPTAWWRVPSSPASQYTITMRRDAGSLGYYEASAVTRQAVPPQLKLTVDRETVPVGATTPVKVTLTNHNRPLANTWIRVAGASTTWERTNARGQATLVLKPGTTGSWQLSYTDYSIPDKPTTVYTYVYALAPGYGLVDVLALDTTGKPLTTAFFRSADANFVSGWRTSSSTRKMILPAGNTAVAVRGASATNEGYYLTAPVTVTSMQTTQVLVSGMGAVPVTVSVANPGDTYSGNIILRNRAFDYTEWSTVPSSVMNTSKVWVTPGTYDAMLLLWGNNTLTLLPAGAVDLTAARSISLDAAAATAVLNVTGASQEGLAATNLRTQIAAGDFVGVSVYTSGRSFRLVPGSYSVHNGGYNLEKDGIRWEYFFDGTNTKLDLTMAAQESRTVTLGEGLTGRVAPERTMAQVNTTAGVRGGSYDANGFLLETIYLYKIASNTSMGAEPNYLEFTGLMPGGSSNSFGYWGDSFTWKVPAQAGTYKINYSLETGPLAGTTRASSSIQVLRPGGR